MFEEEPLIAVQGDSDEAVLYAVCAELERPSPRRRSSVERRLRPGSKPVTAKERPHVRLAAQKAIDWYWERGHAIADPAERREAAEAELAGRQVFGFSLLTWFLIGKLVVQTILLVIDWLSLVPSEGYRQANSHRARTRDDGSQEG